MAHYKKDLDNFEYSKKPYKIPNEHAWDFLEDIEEAKKFDNKEHKSQEKEIGVDVFVPLDELLTPNNEDIKQSSPEITGQFEAL